VKGINASILGTLLLVAAGTADAQWTITCESRDYQFQFCSAPDEVSRARLIDQRSRARCIEGRSWGYDRRGVWVNEGCEGVFQVEAAPRRPGRPGGNRISCESRNYQYEFCAIAEGIVGASLVRQRSRSACVEGRTWGWRPNGVWVSGGCEGDFEIRTSHRPSPPPSGPGHLVCESQNYAYNVCHTGRVQSAQLVRQLSQAPCIEGRTWGVARDGIWVDRGCEAEFRVRTR
jgi:hypothetical protein